MGRRRPNCSGGLLWLRPGRIAPIAQIVCGVGQAGSPEQVIFHLARRKPRGFFLDAASESRDAILERFGLYGTAMLHGTSPQFEGGGAPRDVLITDECQWAVR